MFTGLVADVGVVEAVEPAGQSVHVRVRTPLAADLAEGDSLAVNGVCLTVTSIPGSDRAVATAIPETLSRTTLGQLRPGSRVNLEPAMRLSDRLGGHIVQGHVDGIGMVRDMEEHGISVEMSVETSPELLRYVVQKGSVAVDGVSLTVARMSPTTLSVALIPHTMGSTTLGDRKAGDRVNLEVDILAKYVERMLGALAPRQELSEEFLRRHGFA